VAAGVWLGGGWGGGGGGGGGAIPEQARFINHVPHDDISVLQHSTISNEQTIVILDIIY